MKDFGQLLFLSLLITWTICSCDRTHKSETVTHADSVWVNFRARMESGNIDFLIKNSLDTIQCADCDIELIGKTEFYEADFIFKNHLDKLKHLTSLRDKKYSTYAGDNLIRVNYSFPATISQDKGYNLIFTFVKVDDRYLFTGMIVT